MVWPSTMAWERRGDNRYYYVKRWEGGRCVSVYHGAGELAQALATIDAADRQKVAEIRAAEQARRVPVETARTIIRSLAFELRTVVGGVLVANGFHQHKRQWRKRMTPLGYGEMSPVPTAMLPPVVDPEEQRRGLQALRAALTIKPQPTGKAGKVTHADEAQAELTRRRSVRQVIADYPCIWSELRHYVTNGQDALIQAQGCDPSSSTGQVLTHTLKAMRTDLGYQDAPLLEQLLIEHVALAWLDYDTLVIRYAQKTTESHTTEAGLYWDRRLNSAQQRYLRAVEMLARVRRLAMVTPLQVNIGGQQVNVAGGS